MTIASHGYDGTLDEAAFARLMELVGHPPVVGDTGDLLVAAVPGARAITVAMGTAYAVGVQVDVNPAEQRSLPTPTAGQFFLIVLRRDWAANNSDPDAGPLIDGSTLQVLTSDVTNLTAPAAPPAVLPTIANTPGVQFDQPLAWVWVAANSTAVTVWDLRTWPDDWERVATIEARNAIPGDRLYIGKRVHVVSEGVTYRRAATTWNRDGVTPCTSGARPSEPFLNMLIFETDTKQFGYWDGGVWVFPSRDASGLNTGTIPTAVLPDSVQRAAAEAGVDEARLGRSAKNVSSQDLNGLNTTGFYRGNGMGNAPTSDWIYIIVIRYDDNFVKQLVFHLFGSGFWQRTEQNGSWGGWDQHPTLFDLQNGGSLDSRYYYKQQVDDRIYSNARATADDAWNRANNAQGTANDAWNKANDAQGRATYDYVNGTRDNIYGDTENRINGRGLSQIAGGGVNVAPNFNSGGRYSGTAGVSLAGRMGTPAVIALTPASSSITPQQATVDSVGPGYFVVRYSRDSTTTAYIHWIAYNPS